MSLKNIDPEIYKSIKAEEERIKRQLQMIPSENYTSLAVREAVGSVLMNKYSEGEVGKRYYQGNQNIDKVEALAKSRALKVFGLDPVKWGVEVQAVTGAIANTAIYTALLQPDDKLLSMYLFDGGHLSHGWQMSEERKTTLNSKIYRSHFYHVDPDTEVFDYGEIERQAKDIEPKMIISGGTAYPQEVDHKKLGKIAKSVGAFYLADVSHEAGLVLAGVNSSPFEYADVIMMTTRKTLRGPNGALIFSRVDISNKIKRGVFPGMQGGPLNNHIAGIAVALKEAMEPEFKNYAENIVKNAQTLAKEFIKMKYHVVSGGTQKHLLLLDLRDREVSGRSAAEALEKANIILNMNTVPNDVSPMDPSGIRLGTPALTSRGMGVDDMKKIAKWIDQVLSNIEDEEIISQVAIEVENFAMNFPVR